MNAVVMPVVTSVAGVHQGQLAAFPGTEMIGGPGGVSGATQKGVEGPMSVIYWPVLEAGTLFLL